MIDYSPLCCSRGVDMFIGWFGRSDFYLSAEAWKHKRGWPHGRASASILEHCVAAALIHGIPIETFGDLRIETMDD